MLDNSEDINKSNIAENAINRLVELSKSETRVFGVDGNAYDSNGKLIAEEPTEDQKQWLEHRMRGSARTWERWFVGQYFTEQQMKEMELTDQDITGRG